MIRHVDPSSISDECKARAQQLEVSPEEYRRFERGEKVPAVTHAIESEMLRNAESVSEI